MIRQHRIADIARQESHHRHPHLSGKAQIKAPETKGVPTLLCSAIQPSTDGSVNHQGHIKHALTDLDINKHACFQTVSHRREFYDMVVTHSRATGLLARRSCFVPGYLWMSMSRARVRSIRAADRFCVEAYRCHRFIVDLSSVSQASRSSI